MAGVTGPWSFGSERGFRSCLAKVLLDDAFIRHEMAGRRMCYVLLHKLLIRRKLSAKKSVCMSSPITQPS